MSRSGNGAFLTGSVDPPKESGSTRRNHERGSSSKPTGSGFDIHSFLNRFGNDREEGKTSRRLPPSIPSGRSGRSRIGIADLPISGVGSSSRDVPSSTYEKGRDNSKTSEFARSIQSTKPQDEVRLGPELLAAERNEVRVLAEQLDYFFLRIERHRAAKSGLDGTDGRGSHLRRLLTVCREEQAVYDLFFEEVCRQVSVQCKDRGELLRKLRYYYSMLFARVPEAAEGLQQELQMQRALNAEMTARVSALSQENFSKTLELNALDVKLQQVQAEVTEKENLINQMTSDQQALENGLDKLQKAYAEEKEALTKQLAVLQERLASQAAHAAATAVLVEESLAPNAFVLKAMKEKPEETQGEGADGAEETNVYNHDPLAKGGDGTRGFDKPSRVQAPPEAQQLLRDVADPNSWARKASESRVKVINEFMPVMAVAGQGLGPNNEAAGPVVAGAEQKTQPLGTGPRIPAEHLDLLMRSVLLLVAGPGAGNGGSGDAKPWEEMSPDERMRRELADEEAPRTLPVTVLESSEDGKRREQMTDVAFRLLRSAVVGEEETIKASRASGTSRGTHPSGNTRRSSQDEPDILSYDRVISLFRMVDRDSKQATQATADPSGRHLTNLRSDANNSLASEPYRRSAEERERVQLLRDCSARQRQLMLKLQVLAEEQRQADVVRSMKLLENRAEQRSAEVSKAGTSLWTADPQDDKEQSADDKPTHETSHFYASTQEEQRPDGPETAGESPTGPSDPAVVDSPEPQSEPQENPDTAVDKDPERSESLDFAATRSLDADQMPTELALSPTEGESSATNLTSPSSESPQSHEPPSSVDILSEDAHQRFLDTLTNERNSPVEVDSDQALGEDGGPSRATTPDDQDTVGESVTMEDQGQDRSTATTNGASQVPEDPQPPEKTPEDPEEQPGTPVSQEQTPRHEPTEDVTHNFVGAGHETPIAGSTGMSDHLQRTIQDEEYRGGGESFAHHQTDREPLDISHGYPEDQPHGLPTGWHDEDPYSQPHGGTSEHRGSSEALFEMEMAHKETLQQLADAQHRLELMEKQAAQLLVRSESLEIRNRTLMEQLNLSRVDEGFVAQPLKLELEAGGLLKPADGSENSNAAPKVDVKALFRADVLADNMHESDRQRLLLDRVAQYLTRIGGEPDQVPDAEDEKDSSGSSSEMKSRYPTLSKFIQQVDEEVNGRARVRAMRRGNQDQHTEGVGGGLLGVDGMAQDTDVKSRRVAGKHASTISQGLVSSRMGGVGSLCVESDMLRMADLDEQGFALLKRFFDKGQSRRLRSQMAGVKGKSGGKASGGSTAVVRAGAGGGVTPEEWAVLPADGRGALTAAWATGLPALLLSLRDMYEKKQQEDRLAVQRGDSVSRLCDFVWGYHKTTFGLQSLVLQRVWALLLGIDRWRHRVLEVSLFAEFLEESRRVDELRIFLDAYRVVKHIPSHLLTSSTVYGLDNHGKELVVRSSPSQGAVHFNDTQLQGGLIVTSHVHRHRRRLPVESSPTNFGKDGFAMQHGLDQYVSMRRVEVVVSQIFGRTPEHVLAVLRTARRRSKHWRQLPDLVQRAIVHAALSVASDSAGGSTDRRGKGARGRVQRVKVDEQTLVLAPNEEALVDMWGSWLPVCVCLEGILHEIRTVQVRFMHYACARQLFRTVNVDQNGHLSFRAFARIMAAVEPPYTDREIAQLYQNMVRSSPTRALSLDQFEALVHRLMGAGSIFPLVRKSKYEEHQMVRTVLKHWSSFRPFLDSLMWYLESSETDPDYQCARVLRSLRYFLDREMHDMRRVSRLVCLYRGILHVVMAHQASWLLTAVTTPAAPLHVELRALEHVVLWRHNALAFSKASGENENRPEQQENSGAPSYPHDGWLENGFPREAKTHFWENKEGSIATLPPQKRPAPETENQGGDNQVSSLNLPAIYGTAKNASNPEPPRTDAPVRKSWRKFVSGPKDSQQPARRSSDDASLGTVFAESVGIAEGSPPPVRLPKI